jgi:uncharacterized repeat protein (TIGR04076 family)
MAKLPASSIANKIQVKIISAEGKCPNGHKVGDEWIINRKTPAGICLTAFCNLMNPIRILECNGSYPMYKDPDSYQTCCPDIHNRLVFEIRRLPEKVDAPEIKNKTL